MVQMVGNYKRECERFVNSYDTPDDGKKYTATALKNLIEFNSKAVAAYIFRTVVCAHQMREKTTTL